MVIIGSGPAGLTAAIYAARANLNPVLIEGMQPGGQLTQTTDVENFPGFENPIDGTTLVMTMRKQAERLGVRCLADEVSACALAAKEKTVTLMLGGELQTRAVILATGASARYLGLESEQRLIGKGVSACATCDGSFFKGQPVAVIGGGDTAMEDALYLSRIAERVTVVHRRDTFRASKIMAGRVLASPQIEVAWNSVVDEVLGAEEVTGLRLRHVHTGALTEIPVNGVFVAIGHTPNTALFAGQVELDPEGYVVTRNTRTSLPGVFAAGDVQDRHYKQAVTAAGSGCMAALEAERFLASGE
ncbi:MAG TPA: thioredoxin-disulfide reductase [Kiritimatiellia bacterium]|nr:thioredoxin-disulfide reductase [Kiritimatiellia bacterium]HOR98143.1 thioredoxin-disulfide reductase [Kiritimatiellia bacterium]HPC49134.1 thioredoxin-disulfide reductase [Kiritimatiellia bacterium]HPK37008.1 thioredoxin-disulfide reductase [Kiritimatiellia bacterium]HPW75643.1 thioredoxin-disulfide reductase [Kiritimatiellia bacterium]